MTTPPHPLSTLIPTLPVSAPYINTRRGIAWGKPGSSGSQFSEPCDVLILHGRRLAVDVRIEKASGKVDWAMVVWNEELSQGPSLIQFHHIIDSRGQIEPDRGYMHPMANGGVLETGEMWNPATEKVEYYEEIWHDVPNECPKSLGLDYVLVLRSLDWKRFAFKTGQYGIVIADQTEYSSAIQGQAEKPHGWVPDFALAVFELEKVEVVSGLKGPETYRWREMYRVGTTARARPSELGVPPVELPAGWTEGSLLGEGEGAWEGWVVEDL
ncbi:hypothetical protein HDU93_008331, partial [Gonapodya sp. JEL0774]